MKINLSWNRFLPQLLDGFAASRLVTLLLLLSLGCTRATVERPVSVHLTLGNPSQATATLADANNYLMLKPEFALSYNNQRKIPNWVSWQLHQAWLGSVDRQETWRSDPDLPTDWEAVTPTDYRGSGYDRGHLAPSGDRTKDAVTNSATFVMTNIVPQTADNNRGPWRELEEYCRDLAATGKTLYVVAGGYGDKRAIARGKVAVPARLWKIIVVLDQSNQGAEAVTNRTPVLAVDMPNAKNMQDTDWRQFVTTVDVLETATGYDFLSSVSSQVQAAIESKTSALARQ